MNIRLAENVRNLRIAGNLTQSGLAEKLAVTQRKVSYWESGKVEPDLGDLWKLADFFDVSVDELIGRKE